METILEFCLLKQKNKKLFKKKEYKILNLLIKGVVEFQELYLNMINICSIKLSPNIVISATGCSIKHEISHPLQQGLRYTQMKTILKAFLSD